MKLQLLLLPCSAVAFAPAQTARASVTSTALYGYVPSGMTAEQWKALQDKEKKASKATDRKKYQSRSFNSFVEAMERGEATHLMPVDPRKVASGEIPLEDVPYMQRPGGKWEGSDLKGAARRRANQKQKQGQYTAGKWLQSDRDYENGGKDKVNSFFSGFGGGKKQEDVKVRAAKNGISADQQMWRDSGALGKKDLEKLRKRGSQANINQPEKKFFGLF